MAAKKRSGAKKYVAKKTLAARKPKSNPGFVDELKSKSMELALPVATAFGAYAGTRIVSRIATVTVGQKIAGGRFAKHIGPASGLVTVLGIAYATEKFQSAKRFRTEIITGSVIALVQSLLEAYLPGLAQLLGPVQVSPQLTGAAPASKSLQKSLQGDMIVSPGELDSMRNLLREDVQEAESNELQSEAQQVADELPEADDLGSFGGGLGSVFDETELPN